jgi:hypothetical protein
MRSGTGAKIERIENKFEAFMCFKIRKLAPGLPRFANIFRKMIGAGLQF